MPLKISKKNTQPKAEISKELKESGNTVGEETTEETPNLKVGENKLGDPWCTVGFEAGYTHNLGNYQSARVAVMLSVPCPHSEIDEVYDMAQSWVNERMTKVIEELNEDE